MENKKLRCISVSDLVWQTAKEISEKENRSISNLISILILKESKKINN